MKSTTSADARRENLSLHRKASRNSTNTQRTPSFKPETTLVERATCSSTLKACKFPEGVKVCPYSRCSLHALLPPLKCFVSARRQELKTERSIKLRCQQPTGEEEVPGNHSHGEILEQIDNLNSTERTNWQSQKMDREKGKHYPTYLVDVKMEKESGSKQGGKLITCADSIINFEEISVDEVSQESIDEESLNPDTLFTSDNYLESLSGKKTSSLVLVPRIGPQNGDSATCKSFKHDQDHEGNKAAECSVVPRNMAMPESRDKCDDPRRGLHFLPLEPHPEAEKVKLRHQEQDARKNAEEWMVDYALREAVTKIGQRKVASLVEAFERVVPTSKH